MRIALYLRQSLDADGNMLAIARQRTECLELCRRRGWLDPVEYVDNDSSASYGIRKDYQRLLSDIEAGTIQAVVVWDLDRLYRQPRELEHLIDVADAHGLLLATVTGDVDLATDNGRLMARLKGAVARAEVERKAARQIAANRQRAEAGEWSGNRRVFGYTPEREPDPIESAVVGEMFTQLLSGVSLRAIAADLNAQGITGSLGNPWSGPRVSQFLRNPRLAGLSHYRGEIIGRGKWQPIVDEATWHAAQTILTDPRRNRPGTRARKYLLTGIALCESGKCPPIPKAPRVTSVMSAKHIPAYTCPQCLGVRRDQELLDGYLSRLVAGRLARSDARELLSNSEAVDLPALHAESAKIQGRMNALAGDFAEGDLTSSQLRTATERLREKLIAVESRMQDASRVRILGDLIGAPDVRAAFDSRTLLRRREVVSLLFAEVAIRPTGRRGKGFQPEGVRIKWATE